METSKIQKDFKNENALLEILFKGKNQEYGAFELRTNYQRTINRAFYLGTTLFVLGLGLPTIYGKLTPKEKIGVVYLPPVSPPPIYEQPPIIEIPPPPIEQPRANSTEFKQLVIVPDDVAPEADPIPTQKEFEGSPPGETTVINAGDVVEPVIDETTAATPLVEVKPEEAPVFLPIENQAKYPGGFEKMIKFLSDNIKYPYQATKAGVSGKVFLSFIIDENGAITNIEVIKGIGFGCDEEAKRVVAKMPNWTPGSQSGRPVKSRFNLPIAFQLE
jgi:periplasmic protein TonB